MPNCLIAVAPDGLVVATLGRNIKSDDRVFTDPSPNSAGWAVVTVLQRLPPLVSGGRIHAECQQAVVSPRDRRWGGRPLSVVLLT